MDGHGPAPQHSQREALGTAACLTHRGLVCVFNTAQLQMAHGSDTSTGAQNTVVTQILSPTRWRHHSHSTAINIASSSRSHSDLLCRAGAHERCFPQPLFPFTGSTLISSKPSKNLKKQTSGSPHTSISKEEAKHSSLTEPLSQRAWWLSPSPP